MANPEKNPQFVKLIFYDEDQVKLSIPRKFAKQFGHRLSSGVILEVPSGEKWQVDIVRDGGQIWLQKGWEDFVKHYSISYASFLKFEYVKKLGYFNVIILEKTCSEIHYPPFISSNGDHEINANLHDDNVSVEISPPRKAKGKSKMPLPSNSRGQVEETIQVDVLPPRKLKEKSVPPLFSGHGRRMEQGSCSGRPQENKGNGDGISFSIVILPTHLCDGDFRVAMPFSYADEYLKDWKGKLTLYSEDEDGKTWVVKYNSVNIKKRKLVRLSWRKFATANYLEVDDICFFESIHGNAKELKVVIWRANQDAQTNPRIGNRMNKDMSSMEEFTTVYPYFRVELQSSILTHYVINIPKKFMEKYMNQIVERAGLQVEKKVFPVKIISAGSSGIFRFSAGISAFIKESSLKVGDICVFELIDCKTILFKVSIFRKP